MKKFQENTLKGLACSVSAMAMVLSAPAMAQDTDPEATEDEEQVDVADTGAAGQGSDDPIVVTGSRIKRDTYSSISPLQVLTTEAAQDTGQFDAAALLQRSESAAGQQIDATFQGFVLDNGPGSQTINLRGLGADRTLLLLNGRRLAPAGVEGAPANPSINLIPASLVDRYDILTDGASSVYGSDAVAGVVNIVLRKDFDGPELFASGNINPQGAGEDYTISGAYGFNTDRAFFGIGAEYQFRDEVQLRDRGFLQGCDTHYELGDDGSIRTVDVRSNAVVQNRTPGVSISESPCKISGISGRIFNGFTNLGSIYFDPTDFGNPGGGNTGIPGFSENTAFGIDLDLNNDGIRDVDFQNVNNNAANLDQTFISEQKLYNVMAYGEYVFPGDANITPFFEANYTRAEIFLANTGTPQIFPSVPGANPFNPCNFVGNPDGVDCRAAENTLRASLGVAGGLSTGFLLPVSPIFTIQGDRNNVNITQEQYRGTLGVKGDLPFISPSWTFEVAGTYSRSEGKSIRQGIREDKLAFAIGIDPTADFDGDGVIDNNGDGIADDYDNNVDFFGGNTPCDATTLANPGAALPDLTTGCVPVNLFAPSVLGSTIGDFASQAERDYLFGFRNFDTTYEQILINGFVTGNLFELPAGPVGAVLGVEYRKDRINSTPSVEASNGLLFGFFADRGAVGSKDIKEIYGELDIPLQAGKPWVEELNINLAGRLTDEQFYGTAGTYSVKAGWRPISSLLFKATYGTSFRAPNLRENFLAGQSGFPTIFDPCAVPDAAFVNNVYNAATDTRDPTTLANCIREGRDPTTVGIDQQGLNTIQQVSAEATSGGSLTLDEETSRSITAGFAFEETFGDGYDVNINFNYYDIKIKGAIITPSSQFIINDCFTRDDGIRSQFCDRITTGAAPASRFLISDIDSGFINLNSESVRGIDVNAFFGKEVPMFGTLVDLGLDIRANHLIERSNIFIDDNGVSSFDEDAGEFGFPSWTGRATFTAEVEDVQFTWQTRFIGSVEQQADGIDPFDDAFGNQGTGFLGDTCTGAGTANVAGDGITCRDIGFADDYYVHTVALRYRPNSTMTIRAGITNLFDTAPPLVDSNEVFAISNTPIGNGYDLDGREFFFSINKSF
ncbi:TonB-dependent receptor [Pontixanthobacter sp. CEM42]|uniref:TonB-dependent receptor domain-containing protein n=1 Tax=Pontixanthobacter sp. CEM42 TaxID=2792077 RepID=UPI001ADFFC94|nr:TonB-dependent receptor [Pontixanthobacter sp. CEM42]